MRRGCQGKNVGREPAVHWRTDGEGASSSVYGLGNHTDRLERIEAALESIHKTLDVQFQRIAAIQAEIDLLRAKHPR